MKQHYAGQYPATRHHRRGVALVKIAILMPVIGGFAAFGVEMTMLHALQGDAQRAADAGALAVASWMARQPDLNNLDFDTAFSRAQTTVTQNPVGEMTVQLTPSDVVLGRATYNPSTHEYTWLGAGVTPYNAVQVTVRRTADSPNNAVPLLFARLIGRNQADVAAVARAAITARTWTIVVDNSDAMNDDSQLSSEAPMGDMVAAAPTGTMNAKQLWQDLGSPTYGNMTTWHNDAASMPAYANNLSNATIIANLGLTNVPYPTPLGGSWNEYVSWVKNTAPAPYRQNGNNGLGRYGLRTFIDYVNTTISNPPFGATRQQPLHTVKEIVLFLADLAEQRNGMMGLYNQNSADPHFEIDMTQNMNEIRNRMIPLTAGPQGTSHNIGAGINEARTGLNQAGGFEPGNTFILVISDGSGTTGNSYRSQVNHAVNNGYGVAAMSVGYVSRPGTAEYNMMDWVGTNGTGGHFHVPHNTDLAPYWDAIKQFLLGMNGTGHVAVLIN